MRKVAVDTAEWPLAFEQRLELAQGMARALLGEAMLLSWYDRDRDLESPGGVSECQEACGSQGAQDYARSRGGELVLDFEGGRFVFCYLRA